jgi:hypothetical protein
MKAINVLSRKVASMIACLTILTLIAGCDKDSPILPVSVAGIEQLKQTVYADETSGKSNMGITTAGPWISRIMAKAQTRAEVPDWISISPDHGDKAGSYTIAITLVPNFTGADRTANITISCNGSDIVATVTQRATKADGSQMSVMIMTATVTAGETFRMLLSGSGTATVDWGDGDSENVTLREYDAADGYFTPHTYAASGSRTIKISGAMVTGLDCNNSRLTALDVSKNTALTYLNCDHNQLTALDVSKNTALEYLECINNRLTALDVSKNTKLEHLECLFNNLNTLDVSKNTALTYLSCENNRLTALDVSKNTALTVLYFYRNQLTALDVSKNTALEYLNCGYNQLTALDVSKNTALTVLDCNRNQLTALDVSKNTAIEYLYCSNNQLTALDVSKNTAIEYLYCRYNQLTAVALNALFGTLHSNTGNKYIGIDGNPGTSGCNKAIATQKGWTVSDDN